MKTGFLAVSLILAVLSGGSLPAQEPAAGAPDASRGKIEPVFPVENENLVFVEGEEAVSTNFAREPVLSYSCSGERTLQLNRAGGLEGVGSYYADYAFSAQSAGTYELWYGGTPPGPRDDLYPSYASPFQVTFDEGKKIPVYRETVAVVGDYSPAYYWSYIGDVAIESGSHRVRFEVTEKRRVDGRYFFYLDCFFLVKKEAGRRLLAPPLPEVFPPNLDDRSRNTPFSAVDDYLIRVRDAPGSVEPYVELSKVYTMLGDYLNALKYLNRAALLEPANSQVLLLAAKNRIWKGDVAEGLKKYRELLAKEPMRRDLWNEAGKVAAWMGRYDESVDFYAGGLASFPKDPDLMVNLSLTLLWAGRVSEAERTAREVEDLAGSDGRLLVQLGRIYRVNGYPERALELFLRAESASPAGLEAYLLAADVQKVLGKTADVEKTEKLISDTFFPSPRLTAYLAEARERQGMKDRVMAEYRRRLAENPDDLALRQILAQTYFWNGKKAEAIEEYRHILANHEHRAFKDLEQRWSDLLLAMDRSYLLSDYLALAPEAAAKARAAIDGQAARVKNALSARQADDKAFQAARAEAEKRAEAGAKPEERARAEAAVQQAQDKLAAAEASLSTEEAALAARSAEARAVAAGFANALSLVSAGSESLSVLRQKDAAEQRTFSGLTKGNRWTWDRGGAIAELQRDAAHDPLSRLVLAKLYLSARNAAAAQSLLAPADSASDAGLGERFTRAQSLLWGGKAKEAARRMASLAVTEPASSLPPHFGELAGVIARLSPPEAAPDAPPSDPLADSAAAEQGLGGTERAAPARAAVRGDLDVLHSLYSQAVMRAFYSFEESTAGIRNELGDYYLGQQDLVSAILQFRRVLAIDPSDLAARFRLGKVYQWNRDWHAALESYGAVYKVDPGYENVAGLYNELARDHADSLSSTASYLADTTHVQWHAEGAYSLPLDSLWGVTASYQTDAVQTDFDPSLSPRSAYQVHDFSAGVPVDLYFMGVRLTPQAGGILTGSLLYAPVDPGGGTALAASALAASYRAFPYGRADLLLTAGRLFTLASTLRLGPYPETLDPLRTLAYDSSAEANLIVPLSFIDVYPLRDTTLRTYGKLDYLTGAGFTYRNLIATAAEEVTVHVLKGGSPYSLLTLIGNFTFQHSLAYEAFDYYSPIAELSAGGSLMGSTWLDAGAGSVLGLSLRAYGGVYQQRLFGEQYGLAPGTYAKVEVQADASLTRDGSGYTLTLLGNTTFPASYWSLYLRLGYTLKLPRLLAP